jgi:hypothetical protein
MSAIDTCRSAERANISRVTRLLTYALDGLRTCADSYAAARTYEELRHLSNAELGRRGLSRATLAADLLRTHERG